MLTDIKTPIAEGYNDAKYGGAEWADWKPINPHDHPNRDTLVPDEQLFVVTRRVMDRTFGDNGDVRFAIKATTGAEAGRVADDFCANINARVDNEHKRRFDMAVIREARSCDLAAA